MSYLKLTPDDRFEFPEYPEQAQKQPLRLRNVTSEHIAFKVKTTMPRAYVVQPSTGILSPGKQVEVIITLGATEDSGGSGHKFLVQSCVVDGPDDMPTSEDWRTMPREEVQDVQLPVLFYNDDDAPAAPVARPTMRNINTMTRGRVSGWIPDAGGGGGRVGRDDGGLRQKHEELLAYSMDAEKSKRQLESTVAELHAEVRRLKTMVAAKPQGYELWQLILVGALSFMANAVLNAG